MLRRRLVEERAMFSDLPRAVLVFQKDYWKLIEYFANQLVDEMESGRATERNLERRLVELFVRFFRPAKVDGVMFEVEEDEWEFVRVPSDVIKFVRQTFGSVMDFVDHVATGIDIKLGFTARDLAKVLVVHELDEVKVLEPMANWLLSQVREVERKGRRASGAVMWHLFKRTFYKFRDEAMVDGFMFMLDGGKWVFIDSPWHFFDFIDPWKLIEYYAQSR